ncbi:hypothetical protein ACLI4Q_03675 [Natrialbaceae archaeon A-CW1-1]
MDSDAASRRSILGLSGVASLCCLAPGAFAATGGGLAGVLGAGGTQILVTILTLGAIGHVIRHRTGCTDCES